jgi:hypothetical protein
MAGVNAESNAGLVFHPVDDVAQMPRPSPDNIAHTAHIFQNHGHALQAPNLIKNGLPLVFKANGEAQKGLEPPFFTNLWPL